MRFILASLALACAFSVQAYETNYTECTNNIDKFLGCKIKVRENGINKTYEYKYGLLHGTYVEEKDGQINTINYQYNQISSQKIEKRENYYSECFYKNGVRHGKCLIIDGDISYVGSYLFGLKDGLWTIKDNNGESKISFYNNGFEVMTTNSNNVAYVHKLSRLCETKSDMEMGCVLIESFDDVYNIKRVENNQFFSHYIQVDAKAMTESNVEVGVEDDYIVRQESMDGIYRYLDDEVDSLPYCKTNKLAEERDHDKVVERCIFKEDNLNNSYLYKIDDKIIIMDKDDSLSATLMQKEHSVLNKDEIKEIIYKYNGTGGGSNFYDIQYKNKEQEKLVSKGYLKFYDTGVLKEASYDEDRVYMRVQFYPNENVKSYVENFIADRNKKTGEYKKFEYYESGAVKKIIYFKDGILLFGRQFYEDEQTQYLIEDLGNNTHKYSAYVNNKNVISVYVDARTNIVKSGTCTDGLPLLKEDLDAFMRGDKLKHCKIDKEIYTPYFLEKLSFYNDDLAISRALSFTPFDNREMKFKYINKLSNSLMKKERAQENKAQVKAKRANTNKNVNKDLEKKVESKAQSAHDKEVLDLRKKLQEQLKMKAPKPYIKEDDLKAKQVKDQSKAKGDNTKKVGDKKAEVKKTEVKKSQATDKKAHTEDEYKGSARVVKRLESVTVIKTVE